ncbi:hypothetical protein LXG23DRAFT_55219 [Yarrowia lipolytica]|uniref:Uncharacterized protein n=1 Tax=Yarrowia lipolytica TaxID=4952 RepID=A0A1D8NBW6_YARLL|nr:hypothetical protein YALI1_C27624g [Yarrowia lipolytica]KAJ8053637.1 hypothetical protein LXG23DRAFT_55219 [Yarrowia lipolytica]
MFFIYPSLLGIKMVSIRNNKIVRMYGYTDDLRFSQVFLLHTNFEVSIEASSAKNQLLDELWNSDAVLDANNEMEESSKKEEKDGELKSASRVVLHTNLGHRRYPVPSSCAQNLCQLLRVVSN